MPDIVDDEPYDFESKAEQVARHFGRFQSELFGHYNCREYVATIVYRIFCHTSFVEQPETPTVPPTGTDGDETTNNNSNNSKSSTTMATKKNMTQNESANVQNAQVANTAIAPISEAQPAQVSTPSPSTEKLGAGLPQVTFSTYTTKKGDTAPQIIGFGGEDDPRWQSHKDAGHKWVSASYRRDLSGNKVYILLFGTRYMDVAKALCGAYNTNDVSAWRRAQDACIAIYEQAQRDGKARWEEKKAQWAAARSEKLKVKSEELAAAESAEKQVAAMLEKLMKGEDVPESILKHINPEVLAKFAKAA